MHCTQSTVQDKYVDLFMQWAYKIERYFVHKPRRLDTLILKIIDGLCIAIVLIGLICATFAVGRLSAEMKDYYE